MSPPCLPPSNARSRPSLIPRITSLEGSPLANRSGVIKYSTSELSNPLAIRPASRSKKAYSKRLTILFPFNKLMVTVVAVISSARTKSKKR